jgi:PAS domain S-box-containing protein
MLGQRGEALAGKCLFDFLDGGGDAGHDLLQTVRRGPGGERTAQLAYVRGDGERGYANVTLSLLYRDGEGSPLILALMEDVTERKRAQEMLIEAERLTALGRMGASLAHEINNPLQSVIGCLGLAMEAQQDGEDSSHLMDVALEELNRASKIVQRMRDISRPGNEEKELGRVGEVVDTVVAVTRKQAQNHGVEVIWDGEGELPPVPMARDRIQQVFLNLVLNGIQAMPEGGELRIEARKTAEPPGVAVSFTDTGIGIPPEELEKLFEAFHSRKEQGLGLGLYVSRNIVQQHGGRIEVESEVGEGTTFTVWLPQEDG